MPATEWATYSACACIEGFDGEDRDEVDVISAYQHLINTGEVWQLQGFYGRNAARLIELGVCQPATKH